VCYPVVVAVDEVKPGTGSLFEFSVSEDRDLLTGNDLARVKFRRHGVRNWSSFVVVLDDETTLATVEANADQIILLYEHGPGIEATQPKGGRRV
jgi:hypothetical protein